MSARTSFKLSRMIKSLTEELNAYDEHKRRLFDRYGVRVDETTIKITEENTAIYQKEMDELGQTEVELDYDPISIDEIASITISPYDLSQLSAFITE